MFFLGFLSGTEKVATSNKQTTMETQKIPNTNLKNPDPPSSSSPQEPTPKKPKMSSATTTTTDDDGDFDPPNTTTTTEGPTSPKKPRYKRRKISIFFAYCGVGYQGMQKNPGAKTIEGDLEEALFHSRAVPEQDRGCPKRFEWARSARTDKGVSAVGQVVSGRFYIDPPGFIDRLNSNLSPQIRVFGYKRVTASFNAKKFCDRRRYVYLIPVFALDPFAHRDRESVMASLGSGHELVKCLECSERGRKVVGVMGKRCFETKIGTDVVLVESDILSNTENSISHSENKDDNKVCMNNGDGDSIKSELANELENGATKNEVNIFNYEERKIGHECDKVEVVSIQSDISSNNGTAVLRLEDKEDTMISMNNVNGDNDNMKSEPLKELENGAAQIESNVLNSGSVIEEQRIGGKCDKVEAENVGKSGFCYGEKERERFTRILKCYEGTHNFHNFTSRTKAEDPSARRFIVSFHANTVVTVDGIDFVKCEVVGQSFMLHQIRKMIGLAIAIMRNCAPESLIETAFQQAVNVNVPTAPEVGLYLDECFFSSYNQKWKDSHEEVSMKDYAEEAEDFKMKYIYTHIASTEHKEGAVALWLHSLNQRNYPDLFEGKSAEVEDLVE